MVHKRIFLLELIFGLLQESIIFHNFLVLLDPLFGRGTSEVVDPLRIIHIKFLEIFDPLLRLVKIFKFVNPSASLLLLLSTAKYTTLACYYNSIMCILYVLKIIEFVGPSLALRSFYNSLLIFVNLNLTSAKNSFNLILSYINKLP